MTHPGLSYRADIDGLRAIAVLAVVAFHAFPEHVSGGFVGVDVFFVISGYLITGIVLADLSRGRFSVVRFYERRIRRIFPALVVLFWVTAMAGVMILLPRDLEALGRGIFYATFFAYNIVLSREAGYFDRPAEELPMLHTWSLSVEEQFYLVIPPLLWLIHRALGGRVLLWLSALTAASFSAATWVVPLNRTAAFYYPHLRAWELLVGSLLAAGLVPPVRSRVLREGLSLAGLAAILLACAVYTRATVFPGPAALLPCLGACAFVAAGREGSSAVTRLLSTPVVVGVGLISYSLYLWHWPLLLLVRYYAVRPLEDAETLLVVVASFGVGFLSWKFVEQPARRAAFGSTARVLIAGAVGMLLMALPGYALAALDGLPARPGAFAFMPTMLDVDGSECRQVLSVSDDRHFTICTIGSKATNKRSFLIWGDSHAYAAAASIRRVAESSSRLGVLAVGFGCPPLLGAEARGYPGDLRERCTLHQRRVMDLLRANNDISDVMLFARWSFYAEGPYKNERRDPILLADTKSSHVGLDSNPGVVERALERTLKSLSGLKARVWIVAQAPEVGWEVPTVLARLQMTRRTLAIAPTWPEHELRQRTALGILNRVAQRYGATLLHLDRRLCDQHHCRIDRGGAPLYNDDNHLSVDGARLVEPDLIRALGHQ